MAASEALPFLETFEFVDKTKQKQHVPNHILESKIYAKVQQNEAIKVTPAIVHFEGIVVGQTKTAVVSICNVAREIVRMHIIPPQTDVFSIKYTKGDRLVPGMTMNLIVELNANEYRYYYDAIRIHCPGEENIIIPLHAYPVMDRSEFPAQLKFPLTALGQSRNHIISLHCHIPIEFEYELSKLQDDDAFQVSPLSGVVPANGSAKIFITYQPITYSTSTLRLQLDVSQFNSKPLVCTITGYCQPGVNAIKAKTSDSVTEFRRNRVASPLERSRQKKLLNRRSVTQVQKEATPKAKKVVNGIRLPDRIETVHHVSTVLMQTPGKMTLKELIEAEKSVSGRQMKENRFEQAVRKNVYEERQNQLRWQVRLGDQAMSSQEKEQVLAERANSWTYYKTLRGDPDEENEKTRKDTESEWRRTRRDASQELRSASLRDCGCTWGLKFRLQASQLGHQAGYTVFPQTNYIFNMSTKLAETGIQFDLYANNPWSTRHSATDRFAQVARKIILRNRAKKNLSQLNAFLKSWNKQQELSSLEEGLPSGKRPKRVPVIDPNDEGTELSVNPFSTTLPQIKICHAKYPFFVPPNKKDELAPDALNEVVTYETQIDMEMRIPYFDLQVPQQSRILGYNNHEIHLGYDYVEPVLARELRAGAQEEIIDLKKPHEAAATATEVLNSEVKQSTPTKPRRQVTTDLKVEDLEKHEFEQTTEQPSLTPPEAMFRPIDYPALHIFNATPGLQVFESPVPYAEVDTDYHLCPLPRYIVHENDPTSHKQTQKQYLDRQDVIRGTMSWKKFPSQGLTSLANTPTLTNVWAPRWKDPFSDDMLPLDVPELQSGLDSGDVLEYGGESEVADDASLQLTPEMIAARFDLLKSKSAEEKQPSTDTFPYDNKIPSTYLPVAGSGPVPREKREQELDYFLSKRSNRLGQKFNNRMEQLNSITNRSDLLFK